MATIRSTRRRLIAGTGAAVPLSYGLFVPGSSNLAVGMVYFDTSWNVIQFAGNCKSATCIDVNNGADPGILLDPQGQWYYIKSGLQGSSQRTNVYGYIQSSLSNMTQRFIARASTTVSEFEASGTTQSYAGGSCALHPAGDVILNMMSNGVWRSWYKVSTSDWRYMTPPGLTSQTSAIRMKFSPAGTYLALTRSDGAGTARVWKVTDRFATYDACTFSFSDTNYGGWIDWDGDSRFLMGHSASPWLRYYDKTGDTVFGQSASSILTDNPSGLVNATNLAQQPRHITVSPDRNFMVHDVGFVPGGSKGHFLYYKVGSAWIYQGQIPSAPTTTTLMNDVHFTADSKYCIISWVNKGFQVLSCNGGVMTHLKYLDYTDGLQNGLSSTLTSNWKYFNVSTVGGWEDPAGESAIDNVIETTNSNAGPHYWWKFNEQFQGSLGQDWNPYIRNFGSKKSDSAVTGNNCLSNTGAPTTVSARNTGPPVSGAYAVRWNSASNVTMSTNTTSWIDTGTSGTIAFFVKYTANVATMRTILNDSQFYGSDGLHVGIHTGRLIISNGSTGANRRSYWTNSLFNDGNWKFVVMRQPANGTGWTISVNGVNQALTINAPVGDAGTSAALINAWFNRAASGGTYFGDATTTAVQWDVAHFQIYCDYQMTNSEELAIVAAAGL